MLLDEYVLLAVEGQLHVEAETALQAVLEKHMQPDDTGAKLNLQQPAGTCFVANQSRTGYHVDVLKREATSDPTKGYSSHNGHLKAEERGFIMFPDPTVSPGMHSIPTISQEISSTGNSILTPPTSPALTNQDCQRASVINHGPNVGYTGYNQGFSNNGSHFVYPDNQIGGNMHGKINNSSYNFNGYQESFKTPGLSNSGTSTHQFNNDSSALQSREFLSLANPAGSMQSFEHNVDIGSSTNSSSSNSNSSNSSKSPPRSTPVVCGLEEPDNIGGGKDRNRIASSNMYQIEAVTNCSPFTHNYSNNVDTFATATTNDTDIRTDKDSSNGNNSNSNNLNNLALFNPITSANVISSTGSLANDGVNASGIGTGNVYTPHPYHQYHHHPYSTSVLSHHHHHYYHHNGTASAHAGLSNSYHHHHHYPQHQQQQPHMQSFYNIAKHSDNFDHNPTFSPYVEGLHQSHAHDGLPTYLSAFSPTASSLQHSLPLSGDSGGGVALMGSHIGGGGVASAVTGGGSSVGGGVGSGSAFNVVQGQYSASSVSLVPQTHGIYQNTDLFSSSMFHSTGPTKPVAEHVPVIQQPFPIVASAAAAARFQNEARDPLNLLDKSYGLGAKSKDTFSVYTGGGASHSPRSMSHHSMLSHVHAPSIPHFSGEDYLTSVGLGMSSMLAADPDIFSSFAENAPLPSIGSVFLS
ncbi:DNA-binding protein rfx6-like [Plakobranchus ocellatus]|uniref:DNA-binding protein rfx6-like n=1 Tax=Plakobranchus ocellatus TaxID=259542 RepID=A0AAV4D644_9GAST|nr:DNA-binding protein rfx6-like [Plakobranchus ocellatus]